MTAICLCECIWPTITSFSSVFALCTHAGPFARSSHFLLAFKQQSATSFSGWCWASSRPAHHRLSVLPPSLEWARYFSPFYWTVQGLIKSVFQWSDTYECVVGSSSDAGADQCFIEYDGLIDLYKRRGLYDPSSDDVVAESITLVALSFGLCAVLFCRSFLAYYRVNWELLWDLWPETW